MSELDELKQQKEKLLLERELKQTQLDIDQLTKMAEQGSVLMEAWGDLIDPRDRYFDDQIFAFGSSILPISNKDDRKEGRYRPIFENEQDLQFIRGAAHVLSTSFSSGINILDNLNNYTIAQGFEHKVEPVDKDNPNPALESACQKVIDTFFDDNDWKSDLEREIHHRSREDGEAIVVLWPYKGWRTTAQLLESDQLTQPHNTRELEDWIYNMADQIGSDVVGDYVSSWTFGVHTRKSDTSRPLGYFVSYDGSGADWDYFPDDVPLAIRMGSGTAELIKRNVPRNVKRGVSDFYPVLKHLNQNETLLHNTEQGASVQAAIAFIREHAPTSTKSQIEDLRSTNATDLLSIQPVTRSSAPTGTGPVYRYKQKFPPGTVIDTNGSKYQYGPMGQSSAPNFIQVIQAAFRYAGARWCIPEYMISSDASNNNFASILIAGSPFVQARQADQRFYVGRFKRIVWKVLRIAYEAGYFASLGITDWLQIEQSVDVVVTPPDIIIADELKATQLKQIEHQNGVLSTQTWIEETGRDAVKEKQRLDEDRAQQQEDAKLQQQQFGFQQPGFGGQGYPQRQNPNNPPPEDNQSNPADNPFR